jgi:hypothetical protein
MEFLNKLHEPYPRILNEWKTSLVVSLFIWLFLLVFQPFGLNYVIEDHGHMILAGYGMVTFLMLIINNYLPQQVFPGFFDEDKWTAWKQILWMSWVVLCISAGNYFYSVLFSISPLSGFYGFFVFVLFTFSIAIIPIVVVTLVSRSIFLQRNLRSSSEINAFINNNAIINNQIRQDVSILDFSVQVKNLVYIESVGNYVSIWYLKDSEKISYELVRNTIKNIESALDNTMLFKCHRAFIVNLSFVERVKGNSQGYRLVVRHVEKEIPVARNYTRDFREKLQDFRR